MNINKNSAKNSYVEMCRFVAAVVMLFHHTEVLDGVRIAHGGWIFVEYFFALSGFFMTKHFEKNDENCECIEKTAFIYTIRKLLRVLPFAAVGICLYIIAQIGLKQISVYDISNLIAELPLHFLLLKGLGFVRFDLNAPLWYLTGILISMPICLILMRKYRNFYKYFVSWIIPLMIYTGIFALNGNIQYWGEYWPINCMFRSLAGLLLGSSTFYLSEFLSKFDFSSSTKHLLTMLEILLFWVLVYLSFLTDCMNYAIPCIIFIISTLSITFSKQECIQHFIPNWINKLGQLGMPLYCLHRPVFDLVRWLFQGYSFGIRLLVGIGGTFTISVIMLCIISNTTRLEVKAK